MKVMFDSNVFDKIVSTQGLIDDILALVADERLDIITTHIQEDELNHVSDAEKRQAVMRVPWRIIETSGAIYGVSKYGQAKYGNGNVQGHKLQDIHKGNPKHAEDALISLTALKQVDVFVTEDERLRNKVSRISASLQTWSFNDFVSHIKIWKAQRLP